VIEGYKYSNSTRKRVVELTLKKHLVDGGLVGVV
jgi:hypothetical protein